jgi:hypothetical protein|tara:strand:- start:62 stop:331 length:270 start_codon:yes stop_codon:yes gene_type:complete
MKLYIFESPKDKGEGRIDFFAFGKNILTGDFTIKIIDNNLNVYIENMTIKINGQPEQVKMALRRFRETLLISQILKRSNVIDCTIADSL